MNKKLSFSLARARYRARFFFVGGKWNIPLAAWIAPVFLVRFFRAELTLIKY